MTDGIIHLPMMSTKTFFTMSTNNQLSISYVPLIIYIGYVVTKILIREVKASVIVFVHLMTIFLLTLILNYLTTSGYNVLINIGLISYLVNQLPVRRLPVHDKAVLITGCDQGIGHELAKTLDALGFYVYAGCLFKDGPGEQNLVNSCSNRLHTIQLDVQDSNQIDMAVQEISKSLGKNKLWGIINNAGICYIGNVEMMPVEDMQKIMAVNYFGAVNISKAFLPLLRSSKGRLVNIASNAGLAPVPLMGVYCASKAALASMTEVWRHELQCWGIKVSMIIPSGYKTGIMNYDKAQTAERWWKAATDTVKRDYGKDCFYIKHKLSDPESFLNNDLTSILDAMVDALLSHNPKPCYYRGLMSRSLPFLYLHLPTFIGDHIIHIMADWFDFKPRGLTDRLNKRG